MSTHRLKLYLDAFLVPVDENGEHCGPLAGKANVSEILKTGAEMPDQVRLMLSDLTAKLGNSMAGGKG